MNITTSILNMAKKNNGIVTSEMVSAAGLSRGILKYLSDKGYLERASRGVYVLPEAWDDEFLNIQIRYKKGIYSLETSLFLCKLTDRTPNKFYLFFPSTYNLTNPKKDGLICYGLKTKGYETGITYDNLARTPDDYQGKKVKFYGKVLQVLEGDGEIQIRLAVNDDYDTVLFGSYDSTIVSSRVLEDDEITIYGTSVGLISYDSTMGGKITIPAVLIDKIDQ